MEESYEENSYQDVENHWSTGGESQALSDEEAGYEAPPWPEDGYSSSDFEDELDPKPPDHQPQHLTYSGYNQKADDYIRWQRHMEAYFQSSNVPADEQLSYALDTLTGPAYEWWEQEEEARVNYNEPVHTWESFKLEIYEEFVKKAAAQDQHHKPSKTLAPILEEKTEAKPPARAEAEPPKSNSEAITHETSTKPSLEPHGKVIQGLENAPDLVTEQETTPQTEISKLHQAKVSIPLTPKVFDDSKPVILVLLKLEHAEEILGKIKEHTDQNFCFEQHVKDKQEVDSHKTGGMVQTETCYYFYSDYMTAITHLCLAQNVEELAGKKKDYIEHKGDSTKMVEFMDQNKNREEYTPLLIKLAANGDENVNETIQIKEKPPDEKLLEPIRGKILHPHILPWTNLTYLCVGDQVLRTKLLEEGGYDAVINSRPKHETKTQEQPSGILNQVLSKTSGQSRFSLSEKTPEPCSVQTKSKIMSSGPANTWNTFSAQLPSTSKKNQPKRSSHERVIQFTSRVIPSLPDLDIHRVIGGFRPDQKELSYEVNFHTILTHQKTTESWNQVNTNFGLRDINFINRRTLHLPYLEPLGFRRLQTYHWRPGDFKLLLEAPYSTLRCTKIHRIRRILTHLHFPYPEPILPYLPCLKPKEINQQDIFPHLFECDLETLQVNKRLPRTHHFLPKLSRYKLTATFLISTDFAI
ncbi:hypothetical protein ISN44_As11g029200 [Arabidopsis suecica]|uniref:Uncharacterized protein n=1 Tax=Arabidopsis suecica TaxID=45249 RepID=A0A8T1ZF51_ARASU|nr:hypothetical protein ISN44_As11g029200 [Arabidopsis suecica]